MPSSNHDARPQAVTKKVSICVLTYRRPEQLRLLLDSLGGLKLEETPVKIDLIIVDNDTDESARPVCETAVFPWPLRYFVESERGIAQARNTAVWHSVGAQWIAFVDDDEIVEPEWLECLLRAQEKFQADIVAGPVVPKYRAGVPEWIVQSGILVRHRYPTGGWPKTPGTGNVMINAKVFRRIGNFNCRFGLTGGEDSEFFLRAGHAGFKIIWCDEAVAHESVGPGRAGLGYILRREYQDASMVARAELICSPGIGTRLKRAAKATLRILQGILSLPLASLLGMAATTRALQRIFLGAGMLGGLMGITLEPYRNPESNL
jgi:succinoglycan biosynthesis protein ExoM